MNHDKVMLLGGSGFIGRQLAFTLANRGCTVTIPCRRPHRNKSLLVHPNIRVIEADVFDSARLDSLCEGQQAMINLIGILHQRKRNDFRKVHVDFIKTLVSACSRSDIKRLLHLSALGANQATGSSQYLRSKGEGENLLHTFGQKDLHVTSFQPSVVFGKNDHFINRFANILKLCPGVLPLACPQSRFAPVYIGDLVEKIADAVDDKATYGQRYSVCGPEQFTLQQILELLIKAMGSSCRIMPLGNGLSKFQAMILQYLPGKLFTLDNYRSLQTPSICEDGEPCSSSLHQHIQDISVLFSNKKHYDRFRQQLPR
ncbi:MAG: complex I NDUFA9 subunit family protein [Gammaproteobacteria bacterium]|nr:complex I NDUFA9 subunit family protein [Gammaproteobacteria bacterium]